MSEEQNAADLLRGQKADALLRNEVLGEAFNALRTDYLQAWENTSARDTDARERLWQAVQIVGLFKHQIESYAAAGRLAGKEAEQIAKLGEKKQFGIV